MGASLSWLAVRGPSAADVRTRLAVAPTGRFEEVPESAVSAAELPGGWTLVVMEGCDHTFIGDDSLRRLSADGEVVAASVEEHVMASRAEGWKDGRRTWSLSHESEKGMDHLEEAGAPPQEYAAIKAGGLARQQAEGPTAEVDHVFDIPLTLAQRLTGYKHDEGGPDRFEILERVARPGSGGFWGRLFGRCL
jgi:hypothetical protein